MQINDLPDPVNLDMALIKAIRSPEQAISLCFNQSGLTVEEVAEKLACDKSTMSRIINGRASLPERKRIAFMRVCGNRAPLQFEAHAMGVSLTQRSPEDILKEAMAIMAAARGGVSA